MPDLQHGLKTTLPVLYILRYTDVLPVPPNQTAVSDSQGCLGNAAMENSWEFPCAKRIVGK